ncbi:MAG TPA: hypothetical protein DFR83_13855 [Deltaproteobacteria bacterium]|nr:hypothetical protein [Deltaproteobacteria bacterium]
MSQSTNPHPPVAWNRRQWLNTMAMGLAGLATVGPRVARAAALTDPELMKVLGQWKNNAALPVPMLTQKERAQLLEGKIMKRWLGPRGGAPVGALVMVISDFSQAEIWLGSAEGHHIKGDSVESKHIVYNLPKTGNEMFYWYGHLRMPMPFTNRHFVLRTMVNKSLVDATGGTCWERTWKLQEDGLAVVRPLVEAGKIPDLTVAQFDKAIYLPANLGGWLALQLPNGQTLFGYHASSSLGGEIPDKLVNRYVMLTLGDIVDEVLQGARMMRTHYVSGHEPIQSGSGAPVPYF